MNLFACRLLTDVNWKGACIDTTHGMGDASAPFEGLRTILRNGKSRALLVGRLLIIKTTGVAKVLSSKTRKWLIEPNRKSVQRRTIGRRLQDCHLRVRLLSFLLPTLSRYGLLMPVPASSSIVASSAGYTAGPRVVRLCDCTDLRACRPSPGTGSDL